MTREHLCAGVVSAGVSLLLLFPPGFAAAQTPPPITVSPFNLPAPVPEAVDSAGRQDEPSPAFTGVADSPRVDTLMGQATSQIPIILPPGRKQMTPQLTLVYESGGRNGLFGRGWDLRLPVIRRVVRHGAPFDWDGADPSVYTDTAFTLTLPSGTIQLDTVLGTSGSYTVYASSAEELMLRAWFSPSANQWIVTDKDGIQYTFGGNPTALAGDDVSQAAHTFAWSITAAVDPSGNSISYSYYSFATGYYNPFIYPSQIDYGANTGAGYTDTFHLCFAYDAAGGGLGGCSQSAAQVAGRPDPIYNYSGGFLAEIDYRLSGIRVWVDGETTEYSPTRWYSLGYNTDTLNGESLLTTVTLFNSDTATLPTSTFTYGSPASGMAGTVTAPQFASPVLYTALRRSTSADGNLSDLVDMNGDGLPDRIEVADTPNVATSGWYVSLNLGNGHFASAQFWGGQFEDSPPAHGIGAEGLLDLVDMNGDGLPDLVDSNHSLYWKIAFNTGSSFAAPVQWALPGNGTYTYTMAVDGYDGAGGLVDLNGDGLPDLLDPACSCRVASGSSCTALTVAPGSCRIFLNTGNGFDPQGVVWSWPASPDGSNSPYPWLEAPHTGAKGLHTGFADMNGDGLPDLVLGPWSGQPNNWSIYFNTGHGFALTPTYWAAPVTTTTATFPNSPMDVQQQCVSTLVGLQGALRDMNGDGLPDYVDSNVNCNTPTSGGPWRVFINTGGGFAPPVSWPGTAGHLVQEWGVAPSLEFGRGDELVVTADTLDVNGDRIPDFVSTQATGGNAYYPLQIYNGIGPFRGLLTNQQNGLGTSVDINYVPDVTPQYTLSYCSGGSNDGQLAGWSNCSGGTEPDYYDPYNPNLVSTIHSPFPVAVVQSLTTKTGFSGTGNTLTKTYGFLAPYFDWPEREFRGFRWSEEQDAQGQRRRAVQYIQPGTGPADPVTDCYTLGGCNAFTIARPLKRKASYQGTKEYGTAHILQEVASTWVTEVVADPRLSGSSSTRVLKTADVETLHGSDPTGSTTTIQERDYAYDQYNNVQNLYRNADGTLVSHTSTIFTYLVGSWIVNRPAQIFFFDGGFSLLALTGLDYDAHGNIVDVTGSVDSDPLGGSPRTVTRETFDYSGAPGTAGQPTSITDARGNPTTLAYATAAPACDTHGLYPCQLTNALNQVTHRTYLLEFGAMTTETDPNGATTAYDYDRFGRLHQIFRPLEFNQDPTTLTPWRRFTYQLGAPGTPPTPSTVKTELRERNNANNFRTEVRFYDGLGRALETKADDIIDGAAQFVIRDAVAFDAAGRPDHHYAPIVPAADLTTYVAPSGSATASIFDGLDRIMQITKADGNVMTTTYEPAGTTDTHDENYVACGGVAGGVTNASCPGKRTVEKRDALGRLLDVKIYNGATTLDSETVNQYDGLDRLTTTQLGTDLNTKVTYTYDSLSRRIQVTEKDSGTWKYGYDDAGNLVYEDDPKQNQHLEFCFDALNRPGHKGSFATDAYSGNSCTNGALVTTYTYDTCVGGVGRLCDEHSPSRYDVSRTYDARGRVASELRQIQAAGLSRSLSYSFTYDEADRLSTLNYPTSTDGTSEILTYGFDAAGQLASAATPGDLYLTNGTYDVFGRPTNLSLSGGAVSEVRSYFPASGNFRVEQVYVARGPTVLQTWNYGPTVSGTVNSGYDRTGNLQQIDDVTPGAQYGDLTDRDNDWLYTYDGIGRLKSAHWGARSATANFQYDGIGNMTQGNLVFPNLLNTTQVTFTPDTTRRHHIASMNPPGASPPVQYETGGAGGDGNGGLSSRPATVAADVAQAITYDIEGRVQQVTAGGDVVVSVYDDHGRRIARILNGTDVTFYFGRYVEVHGNQVTRQIFAGDRRIAFSPIAAPPSLTLAALGDDHPSVMLARAAQEKKWLDALPTGSSDFGPVAATGGILVLIGATLVLGVAPSRVRVGIFHSIRRGRVALLVLVYVISIPAVGPQPRNSTWTKMAQAQCPPPPPSFPAYAVHVDHLGSTTLLTAYKISGQTDGAVMEYYRYGPYGQMQAYSPTGTTVASGSELTDVTFTGQRWDSHAHLYYYGARFYDPAIARFATLDPARSGDANGAMRRPSTSTNTVKAYANPYAYVTWCPTRFRDPTGMLTVPDAGGAAAINSALGFSISGGMSGWWGVPYDLEGIGGGLLGETSSISGNAVNCGACFGPTGSDIAAAQASAVQAVDEAITQVAEAQGADQGMTPAVPIPASIAGSKAQPSTSSSSGDAGYQALYAQAVNGFVVLLGFEVAAHFTDVALAGGGMIASGVEGGSVATIVVGAGLVGFSSVFIVGGAAVAAIVAVKGVAGLPGAGAGLAGNASPTSPADRP